MSSLPPCTGGESGRLRLVFGALEHAALDQELRPLVVAVPRGSVCRGEERKFQNPCPCVTLGAVRVEQAQRFFQQRSVIGRLRCSEYLSTASSGRDLRAHVAIECVGR